MTVREQPPDRRDPACRLRRTTGVQAASPEIRWLAYRTLPAQGPDRRATRPWPYVRTLPHGGWCAAAHSAATRLSLHTHEDL